MEQDPLHGLTLSGFHEQVCVRTYVCRVQGVGIEEECVLNECVCMYALEY